jgi:hypothetical protein
MLNIVEYDTDWNGDDAVVLHVYEDGQRGGVCGFTTLALTVRPSGAEVMHTPFGTPVQFAFSSAMDVCRQLGIAHLVINDPRKLFAPDVRRMGVKSLSELMEIDPPGVSAAAFAV